MLVLVSHKSCSPRFYPKRPGQGSLLFTVKPMNTRQTYCGGQGAVHPTHCSSRGLGPSLPTFCLLVQAIPLQRCRLCHTHNKRDMLVTCLFLFLFRHWCCVCPCACVPGHQGGTEPKKLFPWTSFNGEVNVQLLNRMRYGLLSYTRKYPGCLASKIR